MFGGTVHLAEDTAEKRRIMSHMFAHQERPSPTGEVDPHLTRIGKDTELKRTTVGWITVEELTGKKSAEVKF
jgi:nitroimidazol reductase NimA-like FMN-containing flavoprotein (pyridoxamine 5'-phosphate oxidase superfamily)